MNINKDSVAKKIKAIRQEHGMTMEEFGEKFNTSKNSVHNWESGRNLPNNSRLVEIAEFGNIMLEELIYDDLEIGESVDKKQTDNLENFVDSKKEIFQQEINLLTPNVLSGLLTFGLGFKESRAKALEDYEAHRARIEALINFGQNYIKNNYDNYMYNKFLHDYPNSTPQDFEEYKDKEWLIFQNVLERFWKITDPTIQNYTWINERFTDQISNELNQIKKLAVKEDKEEYYTNEVIQPFLDQAAKDFKEYIKDYIDTEG